MQRIKVVGMMDNSDHTFESMNRVHDPEYCSPTINTGTGGDRQVKIIESRVIWGLGEMKSNNGTQYFQQDRVYEPGDTALCLPATMSGNSYKYLMKTESESKVLGIVASRGRANDSGEWEQTLEYRGDEVTNNITTVQKDNMVLEEYAIRKLTPRECWRLMDFTDEQFDKAQEVNSNSQLYKQAGNSIVVSCLEAIFSQMGIGEKWNDRTFEKGEQND